MAARSDAPRCAYLHDIKRLGQVLRIRCRYKALYGYFCNGHNEEVFGLRVVDSLIPDAGKGLFACRDFGPRERVCEYEGELVGPDEFAARYPPGVFVEYVYELSSEKGIDAVDVHSGLGRFANNAGQPYDNCTFKGDRRNNKAWIVVKPGKFILRGEEVYVSYGAGYWPKGMTRNVPPLFLPIRPDPDDGAPPPGPPPPPPPFRNPHGGFKAFMASVEAENAALPARRRHLAAEMDALEAFEAAGGEEEAPEQHYWVGGRASKRNAAAQIARQMAAENKERFSKDMYRGGKPRRK